MNRLILNILAGIMFLSSSAFGQVVTRSEFAPYNLRKDADSRSHSEGESYITFNPAAVDSSFGSITREQVIEMPQSWLDAVVMLHIENAGAAYTIYINGTPVIECEDSLTPADYNISKYLRVGANLISIISRTSQLEQLEEGVARSQAVKFDGSYIYTQSRLRIQDYELEMTEHTEGKHGQLFINVIVENNFNYQETIEVGFDVYDPAGKLLDFSTAKATLEGNSRDTIRFAPHLYGAISHRWEPKAATAMTRIGKASGPYSKQPLYSVMLFTKRNNVSSGYIPFKVGFTVPKYENGTLTVWGKELTLKCVTYNAIQDKDQTKQELQALRQKGYNTVKPDYPQPLWFYSLCDEIGLYVIDQAAINAPTAKDNRAAENGTPSNDPALVGEYLKRVKKAYYRTRNFSCVIAYSLGGESGNGYNMYKAYQWLKEVETARPIIYSCANGEWNSDTINIEQ